MSGCGGNCSCSSEGPGTCRRSNDDPGSVNTPRVSLTESLARVMVDNRIIARTVELYELGVVRVEDLVTQINADKMSGKL
jgi:hypothetical protein